MTAEEVRQKLAAAARTASERTDVLFAAAIATFPDQRGWSYLSPEHRRWLADALECVTDHDIGHGVRIWWDEDGRGFHWRHPLCRAWFPLRFHPEGSGHQLAAGSRTDMAALTIRGSLLCPNGCKTHGHIEQGKWKPC